MSGVNRFYTPSLPQYTSQFVQDRTPWDQMLAIEQQKIARADAFGAASAKAGSQFGSLIGGQRTSGMVQGVIDDYTNQLNTIQEKYKENLSSVPALRELTAIQGRYQSDPRVKKIMQDRELDPLRQQMVLDPNYDPRTDPNNDPDTNELRQIGVDDPFAQYQQPVYKADVNPMIDKFLDNIATRTIEGKPYEVPILDPETGLPTGQTMMNQVRYDVRNAEDFDPARRSFTESVFKANGKEIQYLKALYGPDFGMDDFDELVREREKGKTIYKESGRFSFIPQDRTGGKSGKDGDSRIRLQSSIQILEPLSNRYKGEDISPGSGRFAEIGAEVNKKVFKFMQNQEYYDMVRDYPESIMESKPIYRDQEKKSGRTIDFSAIGIEDIDPLPFIKAEGRANLPSLMMIEQRAAEDPEGTAKMFDEYYQGLFDENGLDYNKDYKREDLKELERKQKILIREKDAVFNTIDKVKNTFGINSDPFKTELDLSAAKYAYYANSNNPNYIFDKNVDFDNLTPEDIINLKSNERAYYSDISKRGIKPMMNKFNEKESKELSFAYLGAGLNDDGRMVVNDAVPDSFLAGRLIKSTPEGAEEVKENKRRDLFKKDKAGFVEGWIDPRDSQYGAMMLQINVGGEQFLLEAEEGIVDPKRFAFNAFSYDKPHSLGLGENFRIRGINQYGNIDVVDKWNEKDKRSSPDDIWMQVIDNTVTGNVEIWAYVGDPENSKPEWREEASVDNPDGFLRQVVITDPNKAPDLFEMEDAAMGLYRLALTRKLNK